MSKVTEVVSALVGGARQRKVQAWTELEANAGPAWIQTVDIEQPLPEFDIAGRYQSAFVVFIRRGVPRGAVILDLDKREMFSENILKNSMEHAALSEHSVLDMTNITDAMLPKISIVIPSVMTRLTDLRICLDAIGELDYPDFETVLVDNRRVVPSIDPLEEIVRGRSWLRVVREPRPGASVARNTGAAAAGGEIIAFTDDDVRVDRHWLRAIGTRMSLDPDLDALTGLILPAELESPSQVWFERYFGGMGSERTFSTVTLEPGPTRFGPLRGSSVLVRNAMGEEMRRFSVYGSGAYGASANMAVRRSALERIGGFEATLGAGTPAFGGEDLAVMISIIWTGGRICYEPAASAWHRHRREYEELLKQVDGYALGFTAMLTRLVLDDPRHLLCIISKLPTAARQKYLHGINRTRVSSSSGASDDRAKSYPSILFKREMLGLIMGPFAYARSWAWWRQFSRG